MHDWWINIHTRSDDEPLKTTSAFKAASSQVVSLGSSQGVSLGSSQGALGSSQGVSLGSSQGVLGSSQSKLPVAVQSGSKLSCKYV
jgi:hypothetical protein